MHDIEKLRQQAKYLGIDKINSTTEPGIALANYLLNLEDRIRALESQVDRHISNNTHLK